MIIPVGYFNYTTVAGSQVQRQPCTTIITIPTQAGSPLGVPKTHSHLSIEEALSTNSLAAQFFQFIYPRECISQYQCFSLQLFVGDSTTRGWPKSKYGLFNVLVFVSILTSAKTYFSFSRTAVFNMIFFKYFYHFLILNH